MTPRTISRRKSFTSRSAKRWPRMNLCLIAKGGVSDTNKKPCDDDEVHIKPWPICQNCRFLHRRCTLGRMGQIHTTGRVWGNLARLARLSGIVAQRQRSANGTQEGGAVQIPTSIGLRTTAKSTAIFFTGVAKETAAKRNA